MGDRNFDSLFERFKRNIKGSPKGQLREIFLREDLMNLVPEVSTKKLRVLDLGCGLGDMSLWLSDLGHTVVSCDLSEKMVKHTRELLELNGHKINCVRHESAQTALARGEVFDLIVCHAVLEWLEAPYDIIPDLRACLAQGGKISLSFFNRHRAVFNCLAKGNFQKILNDDFGSVNPGSLSPPSPVDPDILATKLEELGFRIELRSGLRCFFDYLSPLATSEYSFDEVILLERRYRHVPPFRDIARYVHFVISLG